MKKILIAYASATGNTELIAEIIANYLKSQSSYEVTLKDFDLDYIRVKDILDYDAALIGLYTWTDGDLPYEVEDFYEQLELIDIDDAVVGVFGSGDTFYDDFGGAVDMMYELFEEKNCKLVPIRLKVDLEPDDEDKIRCEEFARVACELLKEGQLQN